jgi:hypothetical protein
MVKTLSAFMLMWCLIGFQSATASDSTSIQLSPWFMGGAYASHFSLPRGEEQWYDLSNSAPRGGLGLNLLAVGMEVESPTIFGSIAVQYGDVPESGWDFDLPWLQEAWVGYHLNEQFDLSLGAFISPIGIETVNTFENYSGIMSLAYFIDPACQSGVQLAWNAAEDIKLTGGVVSSFSIYTLSADVPSLLTVFSYAPKEDSYTAIALLSKEESDAGQYYQLFTSFSSVVTYEHTLVQGEVDVVYTMPVGAQEPAAMVTGFAAAYFDIMKDWQTGLRVEGVYDPAGIFTDSRIVSELPDNTLSIAGVTATLTYKPTEWGKLRLDARYLHCLDDKSFITVNPNARERTEIVLCADVYLPLSGSE